MHIFFSAGEPSGDEHAAHLIRELRQRDAGFICDGFGGPHMESEGCRLLHEMTQTAVMGFWRVIPLLAHFRRLVRQAERHLRQHRPDCVVLVDFPGFNWWIARAAKSLGIPVYYYLPPQLWAWASWRIRRVRRWVDHVICTLPFEYDWYRSRGVQATWVGHPFFDEVADQPLDADVVTRLKSGGRAEVIFGLLPGSRRQEIERNWPIMLETVRRVHERIPGARWLVACYRDEHRQRCQQLAQQAGCCVPLVYETGATSEIISVADACLMVSGSVSLELLARRCPGVVVYSMSRPGLFLAKLLVHCRFISLPNLIADRELMPEIVLAGRPERAIQRMAQVLIEWGTRPQKRESARAELDELARRAAVTGATARTADLLLTVSALSDASRRAA